MLRLLALAVLLPSAAAQPSHLEAVAATLTEATLFLGTTGTDGAEAFFEDARRSYVKAALGAVPPQAALEVDALALGALVVHPIDVVGDDAADLWAATLGPIPPTLRLSDSLATHRYAHASGLLDRLVQVAVLEAESPVNPYRMAVTEHMREVRYDALWLQHHVMMRYALRDVSAADLEAATAAHLTPHGQAAVEQSVHAVAALQPYVDTVIEWSESVLENLDKPIPPLVTTRR